jgi:hypothetical protein
MSGNHGFFCNCKACHKKYSTSGGMIEDSRRASGGSGSGRGGGKHRGGYTYRVHGWLDGRPVTASFGWGSKEGHTLLADGHVDRATFRNHGNHNHYGPGDGPNNNVFDRLKYTGPGA